MLRVASADLKTLCPKITLISSFTEGMNTGGEGRDVGSHSNLLCCVVVRCFKERVMNPQASLLHTKLYPSFNKASSATDRKKKSTLQELTVFIFLISAKIVKSTIFINSIFHVVSTCLHMLKHSDQTIFIFKKGFKCKCFRDVLSVVSFYER